MSENYLAFDLGASSGRAVVGVRVSLPGVRPRSVSRKRAVGDLSKCFRPIRVGIGVDNLPGAERKGGECGVRAYRQRDDQRDAEPGRHHFAAPVHVPWAAEDDNRSHDWAAPGAATSDCLRAQDPDHDPEKHAGS